MMLITNHMTHLQEASVQKVYSHTPMTIVHDTQHDAHTNASALWKDPSNTQTSKCAQ